MKRAHAARAYTHEKKADSRRDRLRLGAKIKRMTRKQLTNLLNQMHPSPVTHVPKMKMREAVAVMTGARLSKRPC